MQIFAGTDRVRPPASDYERQLDEGLRYWRWAQKGWKSWEVDEERAVLMDAYDLYEEASAEAQRMIASRQAASQRAAAHLRG